MKIRSAKLALAFSFIAAGAIAQPAVEPAAIPAPATPATGVGPKIQFVEKEHDFGKIGAGASVKCEFVFTNTGDALLVISNVGTSCGCTTAGEWARQIEPGQTGKIPIQFHVSTFSGLTAKTVTVTSNDKDQPSVSLQVKATVWKPVDTNPQFAVLNANPETLAEAKATVRIVNNEDEPLTVSAPESSNPLFTAELKTNQPGKEFELLIKVVPQTNMGNIQGQITLKTSSTNAPTVGITAMVIMQPLLTITPPQINLPAPPLADKLSYGVSIRYAGKKVMVLSEPMVNAKDATVDVKESEPGRAFNLAVNFPVGFEIAAGQTTELSVKSNHPDFPIIKVPISQPPRPATAAVTGEAAPAAAPAAN